MDLNDKTRNFLWMIRVCFFACLLQIVAVKIISFLLVHYILTNDRILAMTATSNNSISSMPIVRQLIYLERNIFLFLRSDVFAGLVIGFIFFRIIINKELSGNSWTVIILSFLGCCGLVVITGQRDIFLLLAGSVPFCAFAVNKLERPPELRGGDYHNMGGDFYRGAKLIKGEKSAKAFTLLSKGHGRPGINLFPGKAFPFQKESEHVLLAGSPGSGKTQIIYHLAEEVYKRENDKAIVWDIKGSFIQSFVGRPHVDLLAVWDGRSINWSPGEDIKNHLDCQQMAEIIIPHNPREIQQHFPDSARQVLEAVLIYLDARGNAWGWNDLWEIISRGRKELSGLLASFPEGRGASHLIAGDNSRSAEDVYSTLMSQTQRTIRWFAKAWGTQGGQSLRKWVHSDSKFLILGGIPERAELANATANMAIPLIVNEILSLEDDPNRRIWLFLDELASLGKIESLLNAFTLGRSKGLCVVAGIQDMGKIEHHYNPMLAKSISNTFGTKIFLRCSDVQTSQWASKVLGDQDIFEKQISVAESSEGLFSKKIITKTEQNIIRTRTVFTPTEIANFDNLTGVLQVSGWPLMMFDWKYKPILQNVRLVEPAPWVNQKASILDDGKDKNIKGQQWRLDT